MNNVTVDNVSEAHAPIPSPSPESLEPTANGADTTSMSTTDGTTPTTDAPPEIEPTVVDVPNPVEPPRPPTTSDLAVRLAYWIYRSMSDRGISEETAYAAAISDHMLRFLREHKLKGLSRDWVFPVLVKRSGKKGQRYVEFPTNTWDRVVDHATTMARRVAAKSPAITGGPHKARHTFASHFLQAKPDLFLLGRILGHSHTRVTELYSHLLPEHLAEARNVVTFAGAGERAAETVAEVEMEKAQEAKGQTAS